MTATLDRMNPAYRAAVGRMLEIMSGEADCKPTEWVKVEEPHEPQHTRFAGNRKERRKAAALHRRQPR